eukprot:Hpha_TRINITY_DN16983_c0_g1::TRINITY_DN16983_c0_g1_i10::g.51971::m.51971
MSGSPFGGRTGVGEGLDGFLEEVRRVRQDAQTSHRRRPETVALKAAEGASALATLLKGHLTVLAASEAATPPAEAMEAAELESIPGADDTGIGTAFHSSIPGADVGSSFHSRRSLPVLAASEAATPPAEAMEAAAQEVDTANKTHVGGDKAQELERQLQNLRQESDAAKADAEKAQTEIRKDMKQQAEDAMKEKQRLEAELERIRQEVDTANETHVGGDKAQELERQLQTLRQQAKADATARDAEAAKAQGLAEELAKAQTSERSLKRELANAKDLQQGYEKAAAEAKAAGDKAREEAERHKAAAAKAKEESVNARKDAQKHNKAVAAEAKANAPEICTPPAKAMEAAALERMPGADVGSSFHSSFDRCLPQTSPQRTRFLPEATEAATDSVLREINRLWKDLEKALKEKDKETRRKAVLSRLLTGARAVAGNSKSFRAAVSEVDERALTEKTTSTSKEKDDGGGKFDASDQVKDQAGRDESAKVPTKVELFQKGYAVHGPLHYVQQLKNWYDFKGRLWEKELVERMITNCKLMLERHSHGLSHDITVPLFVYSASLFETQVWALWTPTDRYGGGRWMCLKGKEFLERSPKDPDLVEALDLRSTGPAIADDSGWLPIERQIEKSMKDALAELYPESADGPVLQVTSSDSGPVTVRNGEVQPDTRMKRSLFPGGLSDRSSSPMIDEEGTDRCPSPMPVRSAEEHNNWEGLTMWEGLRFAVTSDAISDTGSTVAKSVASTAAVMRTADLPTSETSYITHFSAPKSFSGHRMHPMADTVIWLPPPSVLVSGVQSRRFLGIKGTPFVRGVEDSETADGKSASSGPERSGSSLDAIVTPKSERSLEINRLENTNRLHGPVEHIPPPGLLEYASSRRSDEILGKLNMKEGLGKDSYRIAPLYLEKSAEHDLMELCQKERNQQTYNKALHGRLSEILDTQQIDGASHYKLVRDFVSAKVGVSIDDESFEPTPLQIVHALDLQELQWGPERWVLALSGKPALVGRESVGVFPVFRMARYCNDQPYWHLNAGVRGKQFGKGYGSVTVKRPSDRTIRGAWRKSHLVDYARWLAGTYSARNPSLINQGTDLLCASSMLDFREGVSCVVCRAESVGAITELMGRACRTTMNRKDEVECRPLTNCKVQWVSPKQDEWRNRETRVHYLKYSAPYDQNEREAPGHWLAIANVTSDGAPSTRDVGEKKEPVTHVARPGRPEVKWRGRNATVTMQLGDDDVWVDLGIWMLPQTLPLVYLVQQAMRVIPPVVGRWNCAPTGTNMVVYRGMAGAKLDEKEYAKDNVVMWSAFSSTSRDQGIAQAFAVGGKASVFTLTGTSCRLLAPWSRFGREEEWLFPLNTFWQLRELLSKGQQQLLDKHTLQLYEMDEVSETDTHYVLIRGVLYKAKTSATAAIVFQCETAMATGGILNLALSSESEGKTDHEWRYTVQVHYDGGQKCPKRTRLQWQKCDPLMAAHVYQKLTGVEESGRGDSSDLKSKVAGLLGISPPEEVRLLAESPMGMELTMRVTDNAARWEIDVVLRRRDGRAGNAVGDDGAELLASIIRREVPLRQVDLRNNGVSVVGARKLLSAIRVNPHIHQCFVEGVGRPAAKHDQLRCTHDDLAKQTKVLRKKLAGCTKLVTTTTGKTQQLVRDPAEGDLDHAAAVHAIHLRCLMNEGVLSRSRIEVFSPGWPQVFADALYDVEEVNAHFKDLFSSHPLETEQAILLLAARCAAHDRAFPRLKGALIAAAVFSTPSVIRVLLEMGSCVHATDSYGETACLKASRRPDMNVVKSILKTPQPFISIPPRVACTTTQQYRAKYMRFGLTMVRLWDERYEELLDFAQGTGIRSGIIVELLLHFSPDTKCPLEKLQKLASHCIKMTRTLDSDTESTLGNVPVERLGVTLIAVYLFVTYKPDFDEILQKCFIPPDWNSLRFAVFSLMDPENFRDFFTFTQATQKMREWVCLWSFLNCVLTASPKCKRVLYKDIVGLPAAGFENFMRLRKGNTYSFPVPSLWRASDTAQRKMTPAPPYSQVHLRLSGEYHCEHVGDLMPGDTSHPFLVPAFTSCVVDEVTFDRETRSMSISLISRGNLLNTEPELRFWRDRALRRAREAEKWLTDRDADCEILLKQEDSAQQDESFLPDAWVKKVVDSRTIVKEYKAFDSKETDLRFYCGLEDSLHPRPLAEGHAEGIAQWFSKVNSFSSYVIKSKDSDRSWTYYNDGFHNAKALPNTLRPAATFLYELGRKLDGVKIDMGTKERHAITMKTPLLLRRDCQDIIKVDAGRMMNYQKDAKAAGLKDEAFDKHVRVFCKDGIDGPPADMVYGTERFSITVGEVQQLVRSTKLVTSASTPNDFILDLFRRFSANPERSWFMMLSASLSLDSLTDDKVWMEARDKMRTAVQERQKEAEQDERDASIKIARLTNDASDLSSEERQNQLGEARMKIHDTETDMSNCTHTLLCLSRDTQIDDVRKELKTWMDQVLTSPQWWGFSTKQEAEYCLSRSLSELLSEVCLSQRGYFLSGGNEGACGQICQKPTNSVVFLESCGVDFCSPIGTQFEGRKYFKAEEGKDDVWVDWNYHSGKASLVHRLKLLYRSLFVSARRQGVLRPCMFPLGQGWLLSGIKSERLKNEVCAVYYRAQFELLAEEDWCFHTYYLSVGGSALKLAKETVEKALRPGGALNSIEAGLSLSCSIVLHDRDAKCVARQLSAEGRCPGFPNLATVVALAGGQAGNMWQTARGHAYTSEEDWVATTTAALTDFSICGTSLGLQHSMFPLQGDRVLHVYRSLGVNGGIICSIGCEVGTGLPSEEANHYGPFPEFRVSHRNVPMLPLGDGGDWREVKLAPYDRRTLKQRVDAVKKFVPLKIDDERTERLEQADPNSSVSLALEKIRTLGSWGAQTPLSGSPSPYEPA